MLGNTTRFTRNNVCRTNVVEQRSLTVVNVTHHCNDGSTFEEVFFLVFFHNDSFLHFSRNIFCLETEFFSHEVDGFRVETLVDRNHDTDAHACTDNLSHGNIHHRCQLIRRYEFRKFKHLAFCVFLCHEFFLAFTRSIALFLTILRTLGLCGLLTLEACECFLHLLCYVFSSYFLLHGSSWLAVLILLLLTGILSVLLCIVTTLLAILLLTTLLVCCSIYVYALLTDALTLALFSTLLSVSTLLVSSVLTLLAVLFITLLLALFLRLLLRTRILIERRKVDSTQHLGTRHFGLIAEFEHPVFAFSQEGSRTFFNRGLFLLCRFGFGLFFHYGGWSGSGSFFLLHSRLLCLGCYFLHGSFYLFRGSRRHHFFYYRRFCNHLFLLGLFGFAENLGSFVVEGFVGTKLLLQQGILLVVDLLIGVALKRTTIGVEEINYILQADIKFFNCFI